MKKLLFILIAIIGVITFTSCGYDDDSQNSNLDKALLYQRQETRLKDSLIHIQNMDSIRSMYKSTIKQIKL